MWTYNGKALNRREMHDLLREKRQTVKYDKTSKRYRKEWKQGELGIITRRMILYAVI